MKRPEGSLGLILLAGITSVGLAGTPAWGQDPFHPPSAEAGDRDKDKEKEPSPADSKPQKKAKEPDRVVKTNEEWQKQLTREEFLVTRMKATEPAFSGRYASGHFKGTFLCVCCGARLFDTKHKFESGTGWPSFWSPVTQQALETAWDYSEPQEARVEVTCRRCGSHLGHVFQDGPTPTGLRYCINSLALKLDSEKARTAAATSRKPASRTHAARTSRKGQMRTTETQTSSASKSEGESGPKY